MAVVTWAVASRVRAPGGADTWRSSSTGGDAPYVSSAGMLTSSTNMTIRLPGGGPSSVFFFFSSFDSMVSCVRFALVCAEKESSTLAHDEPSDEPLSTMRVSMSAMTTDLPTPEWPVNRHGRATSIDFSKTKAYRTCSRHHESNHESDHESE